MKPIAPVTAIMQIVFATSFLILLMLVSVVAMIFWHWITMRK